MDHPASTPEARKHGSTLSLILVIAGVCVAATIGGIATQYATEFVQTWTVHQQLVQVSNNVNAQAPKMVDSLTRLDKTTVTGEKTMLYHYTLVSTRLAQLDVPKFVSLMRKNIVSTYRTNPGMETFRSEKVSLQYDYLDEDGKPIASISVGPKDLL